LAAVLVNVPKVRVKSPQVRAPEVLTTELAVSFVNELVPQSIAPPALIVTVPKVLVNAPPKVAVKAPVVKEVTASPFRIRESKVQFPRRVILRPANILLSNCISTLLSRTSFIPFSREVWSRAIVEPVKGLKAPALPTNCT